MPIDKSLNLSSNVARGQASENNLGIAPLGQQNVEQQMRGELGDMKARDIIKFRISIYARIGTALYWGNNPLSIHSHLPTYFWFIYTSDLQD